MTEDNWFVVIFVLSIIIGVFFVSNEPNSPEDEMRECSQMMVC